MSRRYNVRRYFRRAKRNAERHVRGGQSNVVGGTQQIAYTYEATQACVIRSIKLDIGVRIGDSQTTVPYILGVVREGNTVNNLIYPAVNVDMYNPTMDVLISGVLTSDGVEDHKSNYIGRKLKKGDQLFLLVRNFNASGNNDVCFQVSFSVMT